MKCIVTDAYGAILRTCIVPDLAHAHLQLGSDGVHAHVVPGEAGHIDDRLLHVVDGALAKRPGVEGDVQHDGMAVIHTHHAYKVWLAVHLARWAQNINLVVTSSPEADTPAAVQRRLP